MDTFDIYVIDDQVNQFKENKLQLLNKIGLTSNNLSNQCNLLCMVLDDSPQILEDNKQIRYQIPSDPIQKDSNNKTTTPSVRIESIPGNIQDSKRKSQSIITYNPEEMLINKGNLTKVNNTNQIDKNTNDEEDEEEEEDLDSIIRRREQMKEKKLYQDEQKRLNKALSKGKINIYIFEAFDFLDIAFKPEDNFMKLKMILFEKYRSLAQIGDRADIGNYIFKEYINKKLLPTLNMPSISDTENILSLGKPTVTFIDKGKYSSYTFEDMRNDSIKSDDKLIKTVISSQKFTVKIYIKFDYQNSLSTLLQGDGDNTLNDLLGKLKTKLSYKNYDFYYFVEHDPEDINSDIDNALSPTMPLKYLRTLILDKYEDEPNIFSFIQKQLPKELSTIEKKRESIALVDQQFSYNDNSAGAYQEFPVIKINKNNKKQERILGIDLYTLYNELPRRASGFFYLLQSSVKTKQRKIAEIEDCDILTDKCFYIIFKQIDKTTKKLEFEVTSIGIRNQIVAKIKYLMVRLYNMLLL